jgi:hypothetical protein
MTVITSEHLLRQMAALPIFQEKRTVKQGMVTWIGAFISIGT